MSTRTRKVILNFISTALQVFKYFWSCICLKRTQIWYDSSSVCFAYLINKCFCDIAILVYCKICGCNFCFQIAAVKSQAKRILNHRPGILICLQIAFCFISRLFLFFWKAPWLINIKILKINWSRFMSPEQVKCANRVSVPVYLYLYTCMLCYVLLNSNNF